MCSALLQCDSTSSTASPFFGLLWLIGRRFGWSVGLRLVLATVLESAWEILENTLMIIDRYGPTPEPLPPRLAREGRQLDRRIPAHACRAADRAGAGSG